jgi:hypothetical protein
MLRKTSAARSEDTAVRSSSFRAAEQKQKTRGAHRSCELFRSFLPFTGVGVGRRPSILFFDSRRSPGPSAGSTKLTSWLRRAGSLIRTCSLCN